MPLTIPDFDPNEGTKVREIPDFEPQEALPAQVATASEPLPMATSTAPALAETPRAKVIPDYTPEEITASVPDFSLNGDKNPIEGIWDAVSLFSTSLKTKLVSSLAGGAASAGSYAKDLTDEGAVAQPQANFASPTQMALQGLNKMAATLGAPEAQQGLRAERAAQEQEAAQALGPNPSFGREVVATAGSSTGMMIPALAMAPFGGTPALLGTIGFLTAADSENRALDEGVPKAKARMFGAVDGVIEAATEMIPMKFLLKDTGKFLPKLAGFLVREVPNELLATTLQDINEKVQINPDMTGAEFRDSLLHDLALTLVSTPLSGGLQAGTVHLAQGAGQKLETFKNYVKTQGGAIERRFGPNGPDTGISMDELHAEIERQLQLPEPGQEVKTNKKSPSEYLAQLPGSLYQHFDVSELAANMTGMNAAEAVQNLKEYAGAVSQTPESQAELDGIISGIERAEKGSQVLVPIEPRSFYHGTARSFKDFQKTSPIEVGFHFANEPGTAETRAKQKTGGGPEGRIIQAYLLMQNPMEMPDLGTFNPHSVAQFIQSKFGPTDATAKGLAQAVNNAGVEAYNNAKSRKDWAQYNAQNLMVMKWLEDHGFDGLKYKNAAEHPIQGYDNVNTPPEGKWSYAALRAQQIVQLGETENFDKMTSDWVTMLYQQQQKVLEGAKAATDELMKLDPTLLAQDKVEKVLKGIEQGVVQAPIPYNVLGGMDKLSPKQIETLAGKHDNEQPLWTGVDPEAHQQEMNLTMGDETEELAHDMTYVWDALKWGIDYGMNTFIEGTHKGTVKLDNVSGSQIKYTNPDGTQATVTAHWLLGGKTISIKSWAPGYGPYKEKFHKSLPKPVAAAAPQAATKSIPIEKDFLDDIFAELDGPEPDANQVAQMETQIEEEKALSGIPDFVPPEARTPAPQAKGPIAEAAVKNYAESGETDLEYRRKLTARDRFNKFIKWTAGIEHLAKMNLHINGLQRYLNTTRDWWQTKTAWTVRANNLLRDEWRKAVKSKETSDFDTFMVEADSRSTAKGDLLTGAELAQIVQDHGLKLSSKATNFAERVWEEYRAVLDAVESQVIDEALRTIADPIRQQQVIAQYRSQFDEMRRRNYMPHSRFGKYAILVKATSNGVLFDGKVFNAGDTVLFATFESKAMRNKALANATKMFSPKQTTIRGDYVIDDVVQMFQGLPEPVAQMIASRMNLTVKQREQLSELQHELSPGARFAKHFQAREGVPGYSPDTRRVFADYFLRFSNHIARITHNFDLQGALKEVSDSIRQDFVFGEDATKRRQIQEWLQEHYDYLNNPGNELANLRSLGFLYYLGFNPKSAIVNLTQVPLVAYPHLAAKYGDAQAISSLSRAMAKVGAVFRGKQRYSPHEQTLLDELIRRGILDQSSATELGAVSEGSQLQRLTAGRFVGNERAAASIRQLAEWGGWMFQAAEKLNRRVVALSAYDLAVKSGVNHINAVDAAHEAVLATQYEYSRYNRPQMMRGKKSALFLFWQYMTNTLYFIGNDPGRWRYLAMVMLATGFSGLPGADNAMDLFDYFATKIKEKTGWKDPKVSSRVELRNLVQIINEMPYVDWLIPDNPNVAMHGLSSNLGGFDISGSLSLGRIIPGTEALSTEVDADKAVSQSLQNVSGALGNIAFSLYHALGSDEPGTWRQYERIMPAVVRSASRAMRYTSEGKETDASGATIAKFDPTNWNDRILLAGVSLGFPLTKVNAEREKNFLSRDVVNYYSARRSTLFAEYAWALQQGGEEVAAARKAITDYNEVVPHPALRITGDDLVGSVTQRQQQKRRKEVGIPVSNRGLPLYRKMEERFVPAQEQESTGAAQP